MVSGIGTSMYFVAKAKGKLSSIHIQGSHRDLKTWKMVMAMEKSWNIENWQIVIEFCDQS